MRLLSFLNVAVCLMIVDAGFVQASDLDKIDRSLAKEPAYQSKAPKYALLVFGSKAKTRVWLALDGNTLYVDRNGNGDLTEAGEKVVGKNDDLRGDDTYTFAIGKLRDGDRRHRNVTLWVRGDSSRALSFRIRMDAEVPGFHGLGEDGRIIQLAGPSDLKGSLQFSDRPQYAPVLHFAGPWTIALDDRPTFRVNREIEVFLTLGTPGRGSGTFVSSAYEDVIPPNAYPKAEIAFPAQKPGEPAVKAIYELKERC